MQTVGTELQAILDGDNRDLFAVVEFYSSDAVPDATDGFDPTSGDFLFGYAAVSNAVFLGVDYERRILGFGNVTKTLGKSTNNTSITLSNQDGVIADYEITNGFEGLIQVVRILSRSASDSLANSLVIFVGRCEAPSDFSRQKDDVDIPVNHILSATDIVIPRRKFQQQDPNGRPPSDYLFEGFIHRVIYGVTQFTTRERKSGFWGLLGFKKTVTHTLNVSSVSDLDVNKPVPICYGRTQIQGTHVAYIDIGAGVNACSIFCDSVNTRIDNYIWVRSDNTIFPVNFGAYVQYYSRS